ncbi:MAG: papain-like cysteine protease family protein [Planctomycetota bacterium]
MRVLAKPEIGVAAFLSLFHNARMHATRKYTGVDSFLFEKIIAVCAVLVLSGCNTGWGLGQGSFTQWSPSIRKTSPNHTRPLSRSFKVYSATELTSLDDTRTAHRLLCKNFPVKPITQSNPNTCWAASIAMLRQYGGWRDTTEDSVLAAFTSASGADSSADYRKITAALIYPHPWLQGNGFARHDVEPFGSVTTDDIIESLSKNIPMLMGYRHSKQEPTGHIVVLYGVEFSECTRWGSKYSVSKLYVFDPLPDVGHTVIDLAEFEGRINYLMNFDIATRIAHYTRFPRRL